MPRFEGSRCRSASENHCGSGKLFRKGIRDIVGNVEFCDWRGRSFTKGALSLGCLFCVCVVFILISIYYNGQFKRLEEEINSVRVSMRLNSKQLRDLALRDISRGVQANRGHLISKRNAPVVLREYGGTYTRWGRRNCSDLNTTTVYSGISAASYYAHTGGGSNFLCLNLNVDYREGKYVDGSNGASYIYGVEYMDSSGSITSLFDVDRTTEGNSVYLHSVPCSVCMALHRRNHIMIPGRGSCPDGWYMEYRGFIMAGSHGDKHSSQYICVDGEPQVVHGTNGQQTAARLYVVETQCASLLCEPFVSGRELQCVVCSI